VWDIDFRIERCEALEVERDMDDWSGVEGFDCDDLLRSRI
jgi:hypothetical protein